MSPAEEKIIALFDRMAVPIPPKIPLGKFVGHIPMMADPFGLTKDDILGHRRSRSIARPRQYMVVLARVCTRASLPQIALAFGGRDHTTIMHSLRKVASILKQNEGEASDFWAFTSSLYMSLGELTPEEKKREVLMQEIEEAKAGSPKDEPEPEPSAEVDNISPICGAINRPRKRDSAMDSIMSALAYGAEAPEEVMRRVRKAGEMPPHVQRSLARSIGAQL